MLQFKGPPANHVNGCRFGEQHGCDHRDMDIIFAQSIIIIMLFKSYEINMR